MWVFFMSLAYIFYVLIVYAATGFVPYDFFDPAHSRTEAIIMYCVLPLVAVVVFFIAFGLSRLRDFIASKANCSAAELDDESGTVLDPMGDSKA